MDRLQSPVHPKCRSQTRKFDRGLMHLHHTEWHWLDVPERVQYKLGVAVHRCMQRKTPQYLVECCAPSSDIASRQCLRSASRRQLDVPRHYRSKLKWSSGLPRRRPRHLELYQLTSVIRRWVLTPSSRLWKPIYSQSTSDTSALGALHNRAI